MGDRDVYQRRNEVAYMAFARETGNALAGIFRLVNLHVYQVMNAQRPLARNQISFHDIDMTMI